MNLGIIQGRLSPPVEGFQETPSDWKREFEVMSRLNLSHMEWIVTQNSFSTNPLFYENLIEYPIHSVCADNLVDSKIDNFDFVVHNLAPICRAAVKNEIPYVTIPLLEESCVMNENTRSSFKFILEEVVTAFPDIKFSLEAELPSEELLDLLSVGENIFVTYDTGNITSCNYNHDEYIKEVGERISNVHLKDRTFLGESVVPGHGDTDFIGIFTALTAVNYSGPFTLQIARAIDGWEEQATSIYMNEMKYYYDESL